MADFDTALKKLLKHEGGYANIKDDKGGETYAGICRKNYPDAEMWNVIDEYKEKYGAGTKAFNNAVKKNDTVNNDIKNIYKEKYWDRFKLDDCGSQGVAEQVFDDSVNRGVGAACKLLSALFNLKSSSVPTKAILEILNLF